SCRGSRGRSPSRCPRRRRRARASRRARRQPRRAWQPAPSPVQRPAPAGQSWPRPLYPPRRHRKPPAGRVAGGHCWPPAPYDPHGQVSLHAAQASDNVPARYDPVRLRRPTTPLTGRGGPVGLGVHLSVTTAVPATEVTSVAEAAPAAVVTTAPTGLRRPLRPLADGSRPPTPRGQLAPFF